MVSYWFLNRSFVFLYLVFFNFLSFATEELKVEAISYKSIKLQEDFKCDNDVLRQHIIETVHQKDRLETITTNPKDSTNLLRVNLYAYNEEEKCWYFFSDDNIYASSWFKEPVTEKNKDFKSTHDNNIKKNFNNIYLGTIYGAELSSGTTKKGGIARDKDRTLTMPKSVEKKVVDIFKQRNCSPGESFDIQGYAHSEQAFISWIYSCYKSESAEEYLKSISPFSNIVLMFSSTNEQCSKCLNSLSYLINKKEFRTVCLSYFINMDKKPLLLNDETVVTNNDHFNIFFSYLEKPQKKEDFKFDKQFYCLPIKK